jgi:hypothetical protein
MSSTTAIPRQCCGKCDAPRTYQQFINNHAAGLSPNVSREDDLCATCQLPYSNENLTIRSLDIPLSIVNLPGCTGLVFRSACIKLLSYAERYQYCPLCQTDWWSEGHPYADDANEQTKYRETELIAPHWQTDYNTARYMRYREPEYADSHPPLGLDQLRSKLATGMWIQSAVGIDTVPKYVQELQKKHAITIAEIAYDPVEVMEGNIMVDPFTFNDCYLHASAMSVAILRTLSSQRGQSLWQMWRDAMSHNVRDDEDVSCLDTIEKEWMEMFPTDEVDWVQLILQVLLIARLILDEEEVFSLEAEVLGAEDLEVSVEGVEEDAV